ncbi:hypothetical protein RchiOBHm_Chr5g0069051 [Rosa chinensis]|uniref:Uncharacterized protein n=1 Tax=Rosa chinensis TaxID=74649 RepID=A0A2P6QJT0_ROSCH|nr:hypothetical protein RchiOBHm_Chr5g0069051 [Rosa chinensis]
MLAESHFQALSICRNRIQARTQLSASSTSPPFRFRHHTHRAWDNFGVSTIRSYLGGDDSGSAI